MLIAYQMSNFDSKKCYIQATLNLLTCAESSINTKTDINRRKVEKKENHTSSSMCHVSHVVCHLSPITRQLSPANSHSHRPSPCQLPHQCTMHSRYTNWQRPKNQKIKTLKIIETTKPENVQMDVNIWGSLLSDSPTVL